MTDVRPSLAVPDRKPVVSKEYRAGYGCSGGDKGTQAMGIIMLFHLPNSA